MLPLKKMISRILKRDFLHSGQSTDKIYHIPSYQVWSKSNCKYSCSSVTTESLHRTSHDARQTSQRHDISPHGPRPRWAKKTIGNCIPKSAILTEVTDFFVVSDSFKSEKKYVKLTIPTVSKSLVKLIPLQEYVHSPLHLLQMFHGSYYFGPVSSPPRVISSYRV